MDNAALEKRISDLEGFVKFIFEPMVTELLSQQWKPDVMKFPELSLLARWCRKELLQAGNHPERKKFLSAFLRKISPLPKDLEKEIARATPAEVKIGDSIFDL